MQRTDQFETEVNILYNTLKLIKTSEDRAKHLTDKARLEGGPKVIEGAMLLFAAKIQLARKHEREDRCKLPDYPGNQEDTSAIAHIKSLEGKIRAKHHPVYAYLGMMVNEIAKFLGKPYQCTEYKFNVYYIFDQLICTEDKLSRTEFIQNEADREDGLETLKQALNLVNAIHRTTRKDLWDKGLSFDNPDLQKLDTIKRELTAAIPSYSPTLLSRQSSSYMNDGNNRVTKKGKH